VLGLQNDGVLLQEYLRGDEFVIDTVTRGKPEVGLTKIFVCLFEIVH